ncbi:atherin-like [Herpailurus yagouaroundi]|uniref:atherin-like n=1 Tax=Herpailurus yagouaroundi TaxID=1608482 RepID=UPI001AD786EF|nr:atherin-like [Puma yagouaroundi]
MAGRRREHTKEAASAGNKKLAGASPERPLPPCPPPRVTLETLGPQPAGAAEALSEAFVRPSPAPRRAHAATRTAGRARGLGGGPAGRPARGGLAALRRAAAPRPLQAAKPSEPHTRPALAGRPLSVKPGLPGAGLARQQPTPTQSSEEAPPETTEEKPSSKTPPPQQRSTSAPEASAPPPGRPHWPPLLVLPWSTGAGGRRWTVEGLHTDQHRCMPGPERGCRSEPGVKSRWWIP